MPHIVAIINQKGGVGKTTTVVNLSATLAIMGYKVLIVDLDPKANATASFGIRSSMRVINSYSLLTNQHHAKDAIRRTGVEMLDIIVSSYELEKIDTMPSSLKEKLSPIYKHYDFIVLDTAPVLNHLTLDAICAARNLIIPVQCDFLALENLAYLLQMLKTLPKTFGANFKINGILATMHDNANQFSLEVYHEMKRALGETIYNTVIPRNVKLAEAPAQSKPGVIYAPYSLGAIAYMRFTKELLSRISVINHSSG